MECGPGCILSVIMSSVLFIAIIILTILNYLKLKELKTLNAIIDKEEKEHYNKLYHSINENKDDENEN